MARPPVLGPHGLQVVGVVVLGRQAVGGQGVVRPVGVVRLSGRSDGGDVEVLIAQREGLGERGEREVSADRGERGEREVSTDRGERG